MATPRLFARSATYERLLVLFAFALAGALAFVACARDSSSFSTETVAVSAAKTPTRALSMRPQSVGVPVDLSASVDRLFAFRLDAEHRAVSRAATYEARVDADALSFVARGANPLVLSASAVLLPLPSASSPAPSSAPRIDSDGAAVRVKNALEEHVRPSANGVEQSWAFREKPSVQGDLVVRVAASGLAYRATTDEGLFFGPLGRGVRVSHATWVDAKGVRSSVRGVWDSGAIALRVPAQIVEDSAYPAVLDPTISAESMLEPATQVVSAPLRAPTFPGTVGRGSTTALAVFSEGSEPRTYAVRVRLSDGARLELPQEIHRGHTGAISIAFDGQGYVVAFAHACGPSFVRIRESDGAITGSISPQMCLSAPLVFDGTNYVGLGFNSTPRSLTAFRFDPSLAMLPSVPVVLLGPDEQVTVAVGAGAGAFFVAHQRLEDGGGTVYGQRFAAGSLTPIDASPFSIGATSGGLNPFVPFDGSRFLVAWSDAVGLLGVRFDGTSGARLDTNPLLLRTASSGRLTSTTNQFAIFEGGIHTAQTLATRIDGPTGATIDATPLTFVGNLLAVSGGGSSYELFAGKSLTRVSATDGSVIANPTPVVVHPPDQIGIAVAFGPTTGLAAFEDSRGGIYGVRLTLDGKPINEAKSDAAAFLIKTDVDLDGLRVLHDGSGFVVVWQKTGGAPVTVQRVSEAGALLDATEVAASSGAYSAALAGTTLVAWGNAAVRVKAGVVLDTPPLVIPNVRFLRAVTSAGGDFVVLSEDGCTQSAVRVRASDGQVTGPRSIGVFCPSRTWPGGDLPGGRRDFAYLSGDVNLVHADQYDSLVKDAGGKLTLSTSNAIAAFDPTSLLVLERKEMANRIYTATLTRMRRSDAVTLTPAFDAGDGGSPSDGGASPWLWTYDTSFMDLVSSAEGTFILPFSRYDKALGATRAYTLAITYAKDGVACSNDDDCASTYCMSGTCQHLDAGTDASTIDDAQGPNQPDATLDGTETGPKQPDVTPTEPTPSPTQPGAPPNATTPDTDTSTPAPDANDGCSIRATASANASTSAALALSLAALSYARRRRRA